jgi:uncharacterized membrane protein
MNQQFVEQQNPRSFNRRLGFWFQRRMLWLARHWLAVANTFFFTYVGLPILAPVLLAAGFTRSANTIYWLYHLACHQLPTRAYFILGEQVAMCQRCVAIYVAFFIGGLLFNVARPRVLSPGWYLLFAAPMALDGGMAFVSELRVVLPMSVFWGLGLVATGAAWVIFYRQNYLTWHVYLLLTLGLLALLYLQFIGLHASNALLRTVTGAIFAAGTVWFAYPTLEEGFIDMRREIRAYLAAERHMP